MPCFMFHRNQKVVIQNFIIELTGDKYFSSIISIPTTTLSQEMFYLLSIWDWLDFKFFLKITNIIHTTKLLLFELSTSFKLFKIFRIMNQQSKLLLIYPPFLSDDWFLFLNLFWFCCCCWESTFLQEHTPNWQSWKKDRKYIYN